MVYVGVWARVGERNSCCRGRFMFEGGEVHVGGGERFMFEGGEVHVGGGRGEVHVGGGERFTFEGGEVHVGGGGLQKRVSRFWI